MLSGGCLTTSVSNGPSGILTPHRPAGAACVLSLSVPFCFQGGETERKRSSPLLGWCRVIRDLASQCLTASQFREGTHVKAPIGGTPSIALLQAYGFLKKHRGEKCHSRCPPRDSSGYGRGTVSLSFWVALFRVDDGTGPKCHHLRTLLGACLLKQTLNHKHSLWQRPEVFPGSQWFWCLRKLHLQHGFWIRTIWIQIPTLGRLPNFLELQFSSIVKS